MQALTLNLPVKKPTPLLDFFLNLYNKSVKKPKRVV
jgi:hypothetical protein